MTGAAATDRAAAWVLAWCDRYTRGLPPEVAIERRDELAADVYDQRLDAAHAGLTDEAVARSLLLRSLRGVPADLSWRTHQLRAHRSAAAREESMNAVAGRDGWTLAATIIGIVVIAWSALVVISMLSGLPDATTRDDVTGIWLIAIAAAVAAGAAIWGTWSLTRRPAAAGAALAIAALISTAWMIWAWFVVAGGVAAMLFFLAYSFRSRRSGSAAAVA